MKSLPPEDCSRYLSLVREIRQTHLLYDMHVHPYEVLFDKFSYQACDCDSQVMTVGGRIYSAPSICNFKFPEIAEFDNDPKSQRLQDISIMLLKKVYACVGEQVFADQMDLVGINKVLLLPIAAESCTAEQFDSRMRWVKQTYCNDDRFWSAGSVPQSVCAEELKSYIVDQKLVHRVKAIKCHPVVSGIDLSTAGKKEWLEALLEACGQSHLPLIIHGGRNNPYWGGPRGNFGALENLSEINFSLSRSTVVLAHAGFHRCRVSDMEQHGLNLLQRILDHHPNVYVDISGLTLSQLQLVIRNVPPDRILFGSDALYSPQWEAVILTLHVLQKERLPLETTFIQYMSINPQKAIFEVKSHDKYPADQVSSIS